MIIETLSAVVILIIAVICLNPGNLSMPNSIVSMLHIGFVLSFLTFAAYLLKEKSSDERESLHVLAASRISYLVGVGALIAGISIQTVNHNIDPWLVGTLCLMILSKLISRMYSHFKM